MLLGGAGCSANPIAAGSPANQKDSIPRGRFSPEDVFSWGGRNHRSYFHALGDIAGVIDLGHLTSGKADLVAVRAVTMSGNLADLPLGQFAREGLFKRNSWITCASHPHGLVDVGSPREGVSDGTAETGCGAAEGLNLSGVVVSLILKHHQPFLLSAIHIDWNYDAGGIDLTRDL